MTKTVMMKRLRSRERSVMFYAHDNLQSFIHVMWNNPLVVALYRGLRLPATFRSSSS